jgi:hypothetical protein
VAIKKNLFAGGYEKLKKKIIRKTWYILHNTYWFILKARLGYGPVAYHMIQQLFSVKAKKKKSTVVVFSDLALEKMKNNVYRVC